MLKAAVIWEVAFFVLDMTLFVMEMDFLLEKKGFLVDLDLLDLHPCALSTSNLFAHRIIIIRNEM